ncbi:Flavin prenyltransferase UbiX [Vibrio stylophorae]|uniref:Flavin prenyltransferase UbiX n=1 Tax=Vibrio stylophorae TaxID=659351 RepID=A0ABM8ZVY4_9VIBR|nr:flavin prenyltransferase UbiX [Vibrio stylophorae]CAH0534484.1 Flavin prenyltransferase UbiX [Vibrio stylophorae]
MSDSALNPRTITLAWTGASGAPYGLRLLQQLIAAEYRVNLLISSAARVVLATEHGLKLSGNPEKAKAQLVAHLECDSALLEVCGKDDWFSPVASGSAAPKQMVICPCSMGTVASVAHGLSDNLLQRAADVVQKERGQLIMVVRETPFSTQHLANMHALSQRGVTIMPAAPGFYHQPQSIDDLVDFMVARILDHLKIEQVLVPRWGYDQRSS